MVEKVERGVREWEEEDKGIVLRKQKCRRNRKNMINSERRGRKRAVITSL